MHRDLKPANVLLSVVIGPSSVERAQDTESKAETPRTQPRITDFGLAKQMTADNEMTVTGQILGTPSYMPPEQAAGRVAEIGPRSDVYSLGAVLYCTLTGRPPFQTASPFETIKQVLEADPAPPRQLNPAVDRDLETICLKCLRKDGTERYGTAGAVAEDLKRYREHRPILARPVSLGGRITRWSRRHPARALSAVLSIVALMAIAGFAVRYRYSRQLETAYVQLDSEKQKVDDANEQLAAKNQEVNRANMQLTHAKQQLQIRNCQLDATNKQLDASNRKIDFARRNAKLTQQLTRAEAQLSSNPDAALELLDDGAECPIDLRDFTWRYLHRRAMRNRATYYDHRQTPYKLAVTPSGQSIVSAGFGAGLLVRDAATGETQNIVADFAHPTLAIDLSADGRTLAVASAPLQNSGSGESRCEVSLWETRGWTKLGALEGEHGHVTLVALSSDGNTLATAGGDAMIRLWNTKTERQVRILEGHEQRVSGIALFDDDTKLVSATGSVAPAQRELSSRIKIWDVTNGRELASFAGHPKPITAVAVSPNCRLLATAGLDRKVRVWDLRSHRVLWNADGPPGGMPAIRFSHSGKRLAVAGSNNAQRHRLEPGEIFYGEVRVYDVDSGKTEDTLRGHQMLSTDVHFLPGENHLVTASLDGTTRFWQIGSHLKPWHIATKNSVRSIVISPNGRYCAWSTEHKDANADSVVLLSDLSRSDPPFELTGHQGGSECVAFSPDNRFVATGGIKGAIKIWDVEQRVPVRSIDGHRKGVTDVSFSSDGQLLASVDGTGRVLVAEPETGNVRTTPIKHDEEVWALKFVPESRLVVTTGADSLVRLWDLDSGTLVRVFRGHSGQLWSIVTDVAFSPDGKIMATASYDNTVRIWDVTSGGLQSILRGHTKPVTSVAFAAEGKTIASGGFDGIVRLWEPMNGTLRAEIEVGQQGIPCLAFHPDGSALFVGTAVGGIRIWDV